MRLSTTILAAALAIAAPSFAALAQTTQPPAPVATATPSHAATNMAAVPHTAMAHENTMSRHHVEELQAALQGSGEKLAVDGIWGSRTIAALRDYQKQHGLRVTGRFDHRTAQTLKLPHWKA